MSTDGLKKPPAARHRLSEEEKHRRLLEVRASRPKGEPVWIFGFGSLMWNPCYEYDVRTAAFLAGYERKFHIWSMGGRGTEDKPGLGLCLEDCYGGCRGIAYRLVEEHIEESWTRIWDREMSSGVYKATWVSVNTDAHGRVPALTFVADHSHPHYVGPMPMERMAEVMARAEGDRGLCRDYLANMIEEMHKINVRDDELIELLRQVDARRASAAD